jgi:hypothetical protein
MFKLLKMSQLSLDYHNHADPCIQIHVIHDESKLFENLYIHLNNEIQANEKMVTIHSDFNFDKNVSVNTIILCFDRFLDSLNRDNEDSLIVDDYCMFRYYNHCLHVFPENDEKYVNYIVPMDNNTLSFIMDITNWLKTL